MSELIRYDAACQALADAKTIDEVKDIRDRTDAIRAYARQANNKQLEVDAAEIRMRAERQLGILIQNQKETIGLAQGRRSDLVPPGNHVDNPTLAEAGIDKKLSSRAQKLASVSENEFEGMLGEWREKVQYENERVTVDLLKATEIAKERQEFEGRCESGCTVDDLNALSESGRKFKVIYADPPWEYKAYSGKGKQRSAERHYDTQSLDAIKAMPIQNLADDDCALFLWCVMPELTGALEIIKSWGFQHKTTAFTWVKQNRRGNGIFTGMGYWTRANAELCLLATKGAPSRLAKNVGQVILSPVSSHSKKPEEARTRIERLLCGPYLELYGRQPVSGWTVWGNEINQTMFAKDVA